MIMWIEFVLFDLDGTLVDTVPGIEYSIREAVSRVLPDRVAPRIRERVGPPIGCILREEFHDVSPEVLQSLERAFRESYDTEGWRRSVPYPGVRPLLDGLHREGYRCYVVTNKPIRPTRLILGSLGLLDVFEAVISPDCTEPALRSKVDAVAKLIAEWGLDPARGVLVGDSIDDRRAAHSHGIAFVSADYGYGRPGDEHGVAPVFRLSRIADLGMFLRLHRDRTSLESWNRSTPRRGWEP